MTRFAFFISVAEYEDEAFPSYESVRNSGRELHRLFDESDLWTAHPPIEDPARPGDVTKEIAEALKRSRSGDAVLVYFVGHGEMPRRGDQHVDLELVMRSSSKVGRADFLPLRQLYDVVRDSSATQRMVLLDCCDSGRVAPLGRLEDTVLGIQQIEEDEDSACVLTALRADELDQTAHARRDAGGTEYTAFSGTLIDLLKQGFEDGPEILDLERVSKKLEEDLFHRGHPKSQLRQSSGYANRVPFLENRALPRLDRATREQLSALSATDLVAEWACPQIANGRVVAQFVDEVLQDSERAGEFVHCAHGEHDVEHDRHGHIADTIASGPLDDVAATIDLLLNGTCRHCALLGTDLLHRVIRAAGTELANVDRALGAIPTAVKEDALTRSAEPEGVVALTAGLIHRPCGDTAGARAFELLHAFGELRGDDEVRRLLVLLRDNVRPLEADTVLGGAVLGRAPEGIATFVEQVRSIAPELGTATEIRVARRRPPHVLAAYAHTLDDPERVRALLKSVTTYRSFNVLVRLAVALHGRQMHQAGLEAVRLALARESTGDAAATVLDVLAADADGWRREVVREVGDFLCAKLPADELWTFFRRRGYKDDLLGAVVKERQVHGDDLAVFYHAARAENPQFATEIAVRLAERGKNSSVLMQFLRQGEKDGSGPAEAMFRVLSVRAVEDTVAKVLISWETPAHRPERMRHQDDALLGLLAEHATAGNLLAMAQLVTESSHQELARRLIHTALEGRPTGFTAEALVDLLAWWSTNSSGRGSHNIRKNGREVLRSLSRAHQDENGYFRGDGGIAAAERFAGLVAVACEHAGISRSLRSDIEDPLSELIAERGSPAIMKAYVDALNELGATEAARRFSQRVEL